MDVLNHSLNAFKYLQHLNLQMYVIDSSVDRSYIEEIIVVLN